jgi:hypothetical protein
LDGTRTLLLGTSACHLLAYTRARDQPSRATTTSAAAATTAPTSAAAPSGGGGGAADAAYHLEYQKTFAYPVQAVGSVELSGCGVPELVVVTQRSVKVLSLPTSAVARRLALTASVWADITSLQKQLSQTITHSVLTGPGAAAASASAASASAASSSSALSA